jgi:hypothetical protein
MYAQASSPASKLHPRRAAYAPSATRRRRSKSCDMNQAATVTTTAKAAKTTNPKLSSVTLQVECVR